MNRRRLTFVAMAGFLIVAALATWWLVQDDADFVTVGPRTKGVRANFAKFDRALDPDDFRDCKTMYEAVARLNVKMSEHDRNPEDDMFLPPRWHYSWLRIDGGQIDWRTARFTLPPEMKSLTVKQLLRITFAQADIPKVKFIVRGHYIEATSAARAQEARDEYLDRVSMYDRMHSLWKQWNGTLEDDPPEILNINVW